MRARPFGHALVVNLDERGEIFASFADHARLAHVGARLECGFDPARAHVLAARGDDDVLLAINDEQIAIFVERTDVACQDDRAIDRLCGRRLVSRQ